jgi:RHS repeat-associated protein
MITIVKYWLTRLPIALAAFASLASEAGTITYYHNDLLGSPIAATNASGQVIWRENFRPYGERLTNDANSASNNVWYTSRRQDAETGLVYMGARYYDPVVGRFMGTDPRLFDPSDIRTFNRYAYANNNPQKYVDPDGRFAQLAARAAFYVSYEAATALGAATVGSYIGIRLYNSLHDESSGKESAENQPSSEPKGESTGGGEPREGEVGGPGEGKAFGERAKERIRDRDDNKCVLCGVETSREPGPDQSNIDHAWPKSRGGNNSDNNGQNTCRTCNLGKGARTTEEYLRDRSSD